MSTQTQTQTDTVAASQSPWAKRVEKVLQRINAEGKVFINPKHLDWQAGLESCGKGLVNYDGCYFTRKTVPASQS